jgi:hypothetical protein
MLKIVYTADHVTVTRLKKTIEKVIAQRAILALRLGQDFHCQKGTASLLLPAGLVGGTDPQLPLCKVDDEYVEIALEGTWLASETEETGIFLAGLTPEVEARVLALWQTARLLTSV